MSKKFTSLGLFVLLSTTVGFSVYGSRICSLAASGMDFLLKIESLDAAYAHIKSQTYSPEVDAPKVGNLLNRAFFPMIQKFEDKVKMRSERDIRERHKKVRQAFPVQRSVYAKNIDGIRRAELPLNVGRELRQERQRMQLSSIDYNAAQAARAYALDQHPQVFHQKIFLFVNYPKKQFQTMGTFAKDFGMVFTPVGEYGETFAKNLLRTTEILTAMAETDLSEMSSEIYQKNLNLMNAEAARPNARVNEGAFSRITPLSSFIEGLASFHQLVTIMLSEKIPGLDSGEDALKAFVFGGTNKVGLTSTLTARIPLGMTGPMSLSGFGYKNALRLNEAGRLDMTDELRATLKSLMDTQVKGGLRQGVCPVAFFFKGKRDGASDTEAEIGRSGLQILAETYWQVFQQVAKTDAQEH